MAQKRQKVNSTIPPTLKRLKRAFKGEIDVLSESEWEYCCNPEPEISFYRDQIRKTGKLNEEI